MIYLFSKNRGFNEKTMVTMSIMVVALSACRSNERQGEEAVKTTPDDFVKLTEAYFENNSL